MENNNNINNNNESNQTLIDRAVERTQQGLSETGQRVRRIREILTSTRQGIRRAINREFRFRQLRFVKQYTPLDYADEAYIRGRYANQQRHINMLETDISRMRNDGSAPQAHIDQLQSEVDKEKRRLEAIKETMRGQKGFDFIEQEEVNRTINNPESRSDLEVLNNNDPNYLKMIAARGEGLGEFRTRYKRAVRSERAHASSAIVGAILFGAAYCASMLALHQIDIGLFNGSESIPEQIQVIGQSVQTGVEMIKQVSSASEIPALLIQAPSQLVITASCAAASFYVTVCNRLRTERDRFTRRELEEQNYLNISDDTERIARHM